MADNIQDKRVANDARFLYNADRGNPVTLGPGVSFKKRQPLLNTVCLPEVKCSEPPERIAQQLVLSPRKETQGGILWNKGKWAENIR